MDLIYCQKIKIIPDTFLFVIFIFLILFDNLCLYNIRN
ncbi:Uncharacterised protein [Serratia ficaria]|nr:Uncharacterised protein [Serratia ficaria]